MIDSQDRVGREKPLARDQRRDPFVDDLHSESSAFPNVVGQVGDAQAILPARQNVGRELAQAFALTLTLPIELATVRQQEVPNNAVNVLDHNPPDDQLFWPGFW
jgi:hypothetical protein